MIYASIYKNGRPDRFFLKADNKKEWEFLQPYFLSTTADKPRHGNILSLDSLFSGEVWQGRQRHGYGYSASADVYGELILIILAAYGKRGGGLSSESINELRNINTHEEKIHLSPRLLDELERLNDSALNKRFDNI